MVLPRNLNKKEGKKREAKPMKRVEKWKVRSRREGEYGFCILVPSPPYTWHTGWIGRFVFVVVSGVLYGCLYRIRFEIFGRTT
ncbi:hypothetical protein TIFTF001_013060 [Ficus carica]|uniref:Transmembrane protein n=1 Tax=Ficus carica TaxID=3494 RepID=A0AA87ZU84_FICCA|nr:hypothetical protein TIFTF001_013060 [Ficus carica]